MAAKAVAPFYRLGLAHRHVSRGGQDGGIFTPHLLLGLLWEERKLPVVHAHHAVNPGSGHTAFGQRHLHLVENPWIHLVATPALGLKYLEKAGLFHLGDGFGRNQPRVLAGAGAGGQGRDHGAGTLDQGLG